MANGRCGRSTRTASHGQLAELFRQPKVPALPLRYNMAPTQPVAVARLGTGGRERVLARWGLIPHWAHDWAFAP